MRRTIGLCWLVSLLEPGSAVAGEVESVPVLISVLNQAEVPAREAGVLAAVEVREGSRVTEGDLLAQIDDTEAAFLKQRAKLEFEIAAKNAANDMSVVAAEKAQALDKAIFQRAQAGAQQDPHSISQTELDRLSLNVVKAELSFRQARHELDVAQITQRLKQNEHDFASRTVDRRRIVAPVSGMVVEVNRRRGEWVEPGHKVLRIVCLDRLQAEGYLSARLAQADLAGQPVTLTADPAENLPGRFQGKIVFISPEIDPVNRQVQVLAEIENPDFKLRPGAHAVMSLDTTGRPGSK